MNIWRVDVRNQSLTVEPIPEAWQRLGGRGLSAKILLDEGVASSEPLGPDNKLVFAPGLLVGHRISSLDRISIGGKSPLTKGIKEANAGGRTGYHLAQLGIKALIIEGQPTEKEFQILHISKDGLRTISGNGMKGIGVYETASLLIKQFGEDVAIALIGPGGEMKLKSAGIQNIDKDKVPSRIAARGGLGAVMGSKFIKAIVIDANGGKQPSIVDEISFKEARKSFSTALSAHPQINLYGQFGTAGMANFCNNFGALPTLNFSQGTFEKVEKISGEFLRDLILKRGGDGNTTHACMSGCSIRCSNIFADESGSQVLVSPVEYETIGLMGSNLGINDLDMIAKMNWEANDLGLDTIEIGAALGIACEAGLMKFGDGERGLELIREIRAGTETGTILGNGAAATGHAYRIERIPVVKNQAISAYDPRAVKGTGVTYATSPQGADHTCGLTIRVKVKHTLVEGQTNLSRQSQYKMAGYDSLGACLFSGFGFADAPDSIFGLVNARYGTSYDQNLLIDMGKETLKYELAFNRQAGFSKKDDRLPKWMSREALPPHNTVFDVPDEELDHIFDELE